MYHTKNDLSAGKVRLDYKALLETAEIAFAKTTQTISSLCSNISNDYGKTVKSYMEADYLAIEAKRLVTITETLFTLRELPIRKT